RGATPGYRGRNAWRHADRPLGARDESGAEGDLAPPSFTLRRIRASAKRASPSRQCLGRGLLPPRGEGETNRPGGPMRLTSRAGADATWPQACGAECRLPQAMESSEKVSTARLCRAPSGRAVII